MTYNLYYCDDAERILKGSFETKKQAIQGSMTCAVTSLNLVHMDLI